MGLNCSHGAFDGAYSAFNRFRGAVARAMGGSWPPHENKELIADHWYWGDGFSENTHPGLYVFFCHSDCEGYIKASDCKKIADEMEALLPEIGRLGTGGGHIERDGGYRKVAERFIAGCRLASSKRQRLKFG